MWLYTGPSDFEWELLKLSAAGFVASHTGAVVARHYAPHEFEPHIPTALEDWDADFERATGIRVEKEPHPSTWR